jgi:hypothetical protein
LRSTSAASLPASRMPSISSRLLMVMAMNGQMGVRRGF